MKKLKLFSLALMALFATSAWATSYIPGTRKVVTADETLTYTTFTGANATTEGKWIVNPRGGTTSSKKYTNVNGDSNGNPDGITDNIASISSNVNMATIQVPSTAKYNQSGKYVIHMRIIGITGLIVHGVTGSSGYGVAVYGQEYSNSLTENTEYGTALASMTRKSNSGSFILKYTGFTASKEYLITIAAVGGDDQLYAIELLAPECDAETPGAISKGTLNDGYLTLDVDGEPSAKNVWYWQTSATSTSTGIEFDVENPRTVNAAGTYYLRSYYNSSCWGDASSITVTEADLVENYTVVYKDGETPLGSETVEVGQKPTASEITTAKDCYTFDAWQKGGEDITLTDNYWATVTDGTTVTLTARYTPNYASTIDYVDNAGTAPAIVTFAEGYNVYMSNLGSKSGWDNGDKSGYVGYKLKNEGATVKFLVKAGKQVIITLGSVGANVTFKKGEVTSTISAAAGDDAKTIVPAFIPAEDMVVSLTTTSESTVTLKSIVINSLYNATYTSEKGTAPENETNVPEVTLEQITGVSGWVHTGWKADVDVTVDDATVTANTLIANGKTAVLSANTTFIAQWTKLYSVVYDANGAEGTAPTEEDHLAGDKFEIADQGDLETPANKVFGGWIYSTNTYAAGAEFTMPESDVEFVANWVDAYTVTYKANGGTGEDVVRNNPATIEDNMFTAPSKKVFVNWNTQADGKGTAYEVDDAVSSTLILFAQWDDIPCPASGTIFFADAITTSDVAFSTGTTLITDAQANITGGKLYAISEQSESKNLLTKSGYFSITNNNTFFKIELDCALHSGDTIKIDAQGGTKGSDAKGLWVSTAASRPSSAPAAAGTNTTDSWHAPMLTYVVTSTDEYYNKDIFYIYRAAGATQSFDKIRVIRPDGSATALENTEAGVKAVKRLENGMLVIEKNGVRYNAQGQIVR